MKDDDDCPTCGAHHMGACEVLVRDREEADEVVKLRQQRDALMNAARMVLDELDLPETLRLAPWQDSALKMLRDTVALVKAAQ